ncbi:MAG: hypothetical protein CME70_09150 [Halobacteriovorax sp.]|nr:hypothetical protein [Halobacteriovorax sp.]|tara:strand:- start:17629 stop:18735 length:1107 start_codon:yes stop_codon:yes gene_type:complete
MRKAKPKFLFTIMSLLVGAGIGVFGYLGYQKSITDQFVQEGEDQLKLLEASSKVWSVWRKGIYSELYKEASKECPVEEYGENTKCNQKLLNCVLKNSSISPSLKGVGKIKLGKAETVSREVHGRMAPLDGVRLNISLRDSKLSILLENSCDKIFLPKRIYGFGPDKNPKSEFRFDNFERLIFIDKNLSSAKGKTIAQMKRVCASRGMQLLESHILDAAAFHPVDIRNNRPQEFLRPKLPWSRNYKSEFPYKAQTDKKFKFESKYCDYLYSKECIGKKDTSLPSWMGLKNPLGGKMEVVRNIKFEDQVLVPSSIYFSVESLWHQLGLRAMWNGKSFDKRDFVFSKLGAPALDDYSNLELGFRCMQEVWK